MPNMPDRVVVVDIEATCWENKRERPPGEESEIIEIGVCALDLETLAPLEKDSILVRPERSRVGPFCEGLTSLTQEMVDAGESFAEACALLRERHRTGEFPWASYGNYDINKFRKQCEQRGVEYPFGEAHLNVKAAAAEALGTKRQIGMKATLEMLGVELEGVHHRGDDDARNIARALAAMIGRFGPGAAFFAPLRQDPRAAPREEEAATSSEARP